MTGQSLQGWSTQGEPGSGVGTQRRSRYTGETIRRARGVRRTKILLGSEQEGWWQEMGQRAGCKTGNIRMGRMFSLNTRLSGHKVPSAEKGCQRQKD